MHSTPPSQFRTVVLRPPRLLPALVFALLGGWVLAGGLVFNGDLFDWVEHRYGDAARDRVEALERLITDASALSETERLDRVNRFFNRLDYASDHALWDQKDYWATPFEVLGLNAADCEDYALSKYFTLLSMGVEEARLRVTYVKSLTLNEAHMVLAYYPQPEAEPWILDNLSDDISPARARSDLVPVYSFNGADLWLAVNRAEGRRVGSADRLSRWQDYQARLLRQMAAAP
jgi:predicted transglutaminase-like cysteine proteinase